MRKHPTLIYIAVAAIALTGCSQIKTVASEAGVHSPPKTAMVWEYPASDFPTMCMLMQPDGTLAFKGGFAFFNPGTWKYGTKPETIVIQLGGTADFPNNSSKSDSPNLLHANPKTRELEFQIRPAPDNYISVGGFNFFRTERCNAA
jgi:hypothetical protein